jgi:adenosylmethionine-8-amino-7-oxononanoate aminotransferase
MSDIAALRRADLAHVWHPCTPTDAFEQSAFPIMERGEGVWLYSVDGRRYLDAIASWWCVNLGHSHPRLVAAMREQAGRLQHCILGGMSHPPVIELAGRLAAIAPPGLRHSFFAGDGASAVEAALKIALQYWRNIGVEGRTEFIALEEGYHGDTLGAIGVGYVDAFHRDFAAVVRPAHRACSPHCAQCPFGREPESCALECFDSMERLLTERAGRIAAVIVEPLCQGAAGMRIYPPKYLQRLRALCDKHDVLLIADEIATGFGRTGEWFACSLAGISPDIMTIGKGLTGGTLPMSATMVTTRLYDAFRDGPGGADRTFWHSHTYGGNPVAAAVANEAIRVYTEEGVLDHARDMAPRLAAVVGRAAALLPGSRVRTLGMIGVVEVSDAAGGAARARAIGRAAVAAGLLLRPRGRAVYIWPPLTITAAELDTLESLLLAAIRATESTTP